MTGSPTQPETTRFRLFPKDFYQQLLSEGIFLFRFMVCLLLATQADLFPEGKLPGFPSHSGCAFTLSNPCAMAKRHCFSG
jgi:hypothetical protein